MGAYVQARPHKARAERRKRANQRRDYSGKPCPYCGLPMLSDVVPDHPRRVTKDHVFPLALGGDRTVRCCFECNNRKGNMTPTEWLAFVVRVMPERANAVREVFKRYRLNWIEPPPA